MLERQLTLYEFNLNYLRLLAVNFNDSTRGSAPFEGANPPVWILGPLAVATDYAGKILGLARACPREWHVKFGPGSKPSELVPPWPTKEGLMVTIENGHRRVADAAVGVSAAVLNQPHSIEPLKPMLLKTTAMCLHFSFVGARRSTSSGYPRAAARWARDRSSDCHRRYARIAEPSPALSVRSACPMLPPRDSPCNHRLHERRRDMTLNVSLAAALHLATGPASRTSDLPGPARLSEFTVECRVVDKRHAFQVPRITTLDGGTASVRDVSVVPIVVARRTADDQSNPLTRVFSKATTMDVTVTRLNADLVLLEIKLNLQGSTPGRRPMPARKCAFTASAASWRSACRSAQARSSRSRT